MRSRHQYGSSTYHVLLGQSRVGASCSFECRYLGSDLLDLSLNLLQGSHGGCSLGCNRASPPAGCYFVVVEPGARRGRILQNHAARI